MSEWKKCPIGEVVTLRQGFAINAKSKHYMSKEETSLPLLRIADMKNGTKEVFVKEEIPQRFIAHPEDIIYTRTGNVGLVSHANGGMCKPDWGRGGTKKKIGLTPYPWLCRPCWAD